MGSRSETDLSSHVITVSFGQHKCLVLLFQNYSFKISFCVSLAQEKVTQKTRIYVLSSQRRTFCASSLADRCCIGLYGIVCYRNEIDDSMMSFKTRHFFETVRVIEMLTVLMAYKLLDRGKVNLYEKELSVQNSIRRTMKTSVEKCWRRLPE
jgi:hypothetical protein